MSIRNGQLRNRVTIQQLATGSPDVFPSGEPDAAWTDVKTVWAAIEPLRGRELLAAQQIASEVSGTITIRYRAGVTAGMRVKFGTRLYDILAPVDPMERHEKLILYVREGPNDG